RLFVFTPADGYRIETHAAGVLNSEMAQPSDALDGDEVSRARAGIAQRVEDGDASAHERRGLFRRQTLRDRRHGLRWGDHRFLISSIEMNRRDLLEQTKHEV